MVDIQHDSPVPIAEQTMGIKFAEDIRTLSEVEDDVKGAVDRVERTGRPLVITKRGKPAAVMVDAETYEKRVHTRNVGRLLAQAQAEIRAGKGQPLEAFFAELDREEKLPRHRRAKRRK